LGANSLFLCHLVSRGTSPLEVAAGESLELLDACCGNE